MGLILALGGAFLILWKVPLWAWYGLLGLLLTALAVLWYFQR
ncbi:MAG: hypothetical protein Q4C22_06800 [Bacillota bacterium]|nr:hypothetical protein [Bacillota bacterium]